MKNLKNKIDTIIHMMVYNIVSIKRKENPKLYSQISKLKWDEVDSIHDSIIIIKEKLRLHLLK